MIPIHENQIGGGKVMRSFNMCGKQLRSGHLLTAAEVFSIRTMNRNALIESGRLYVWPKGAPEDPPAAGNVRFVRPLGYGKYDVIEGRKLNADGPLSKEAAHELAGIPLPEDNKKN